MIDYYYINSYELESMFLLYDIWPNDPKLYIILFLFLLFLF